MLLRIARKRYCLQKHITHDFITFIRNVKDKYLKLNIPSFRDKEILVEITLDAVNNPSVRFVFLRLERTSIVGLTL